MSDGLGAGFGALMLYALLLGLAALLTVATVVRVTWHDDTVQSAVQAVSGVVSVFVAVVAGFAVLALFDEAPAAAVLFVGTAAFPLGLLLTRTWVRDVGSLTAVATAGMAWSVPFLAATGVLVGLVSQTDLEPWLATASASVLTTGGGLLAEAALHATQKRTETDA